MPGSAQRRVGLVPDRANAGSGRCGTGPVPGRASAGSMRRRADAGAIVPSPRPLVQAYTGASLIDFVSQPFAQA